MQRTRKLALYGAFAAICLLSSLVAGRPELAALGAPFALILILGLSLPRPAVPQVSMEVKRPRAFEGEEVEADLVICAPARIPTLDLVLLLPEGVSLVKSSARFLLKLEKGEERRVPLRLACNRWGIFRLTDATFRASDTLGLRSADGRCQGKELLRVYPKSERLRLLVNPFETQPFAGNRVARVRGEGIEFADVRPYMPGDRPRRINWRASSLHGAIHVNDQHPERNSDVIIFLDSFAEARQGTASTLDPTVRAAASLARHYLATRDRVGLVSFGGIVRWLVPSAGSIQYYRIVEALLETEIALSYVWKGIDVLPARSLTPQALVIALTPLLDERSVSALLNLRRRGFDLVVVEMSPMAFTRSSGASMDLTAARFWRLWRDATRFHFEQMGVAVVEWEGDTPLVAVVEEVRAFRRFARYAFG
jgi:uncharacterized protein (DUF58 family)